MKAQVLRPGPPRTTPGLAVKEPKRTSHKKTRCLIVVAVVVVIAIIAILVFMNPNVNNKAVSQSGITIMSTTLHVFAYGSSPYNNFFQALNVTGLAKGSGYLSNVDVYLNNVELGPPPLGFFHATSGQQWSARYAVLPMTVSIGQTYAVRVVATFSDGSVSTESTRVTATQCVSLLSC